MNTATLEAAVREFDVDMWLAEEAAAVGNTPKAAAHTNQMRLLITEPEVYASIPEERRGGLENLTQRLKSSVPADEEQHFRKVIDEQVWYAQEAYGVQNPDLLKVRSCIQRIEAVIHNPVAALFIDEKKLKEITDLQSRLRRDINLRKGYGAIPQAS